jgi:hypothetical protein
MRIFPALTASPNGADVAVKDSKRFADIHGWAATIQSFNHNEPIAQTAKVRAKGGNAPTAISPMPRRMTL